MKKLFNLLDLLYLDLDNILSILEFNYFSLEEDYIIDKLTGESLIYLNSINRLIIKENNSFVHYKLSLLLFKFNILFK